MVFQERLDNGIRVVGESLNNYRSVSLGVWIGTGSVCEEDGQRGMSHFIEHMVFKGTNRRTAHQVATEMDGIGGSMNAFTAKECTCFYAKVLDEHIETAADVLSDIVRNPKLDEGDIEKEKGVVCEEILMTEDSPEDLVHEALCAEYYGEDAIAKPILGTQDSVRAFTRQGIQQYMRRFYNPNNMVIACAGNISKGRLMEVAGKYFGGGSGGEKNSAGKSTPAAGRRFKAIEKDIEQVHICLGMPGYAIETAGQYPLIVLNNALGGSMSSRLFQKIREEKGLAYTVYSYPSAYSTTGYFALYAGTGEKQAAQVVELMLEELGAIKKGGLSKEEFIRSKEQLKGSFVLGQESTSSRASAIGKSALLKDKLYSDDEILNKIDSVTMDDIMEILPHVADFDNITGAFVGRMTKQEQQIQKMITG